MKPEWISAKSTFEYVLAIELTQDTTRQKLMKRIQSGEIPGMDSYNQIVPASFWDTRGRSAHVEVDFPSGAAVRKDYPISGPANTPWAPTSVKTISGLQFSVRHLRQCFPASEASLQRQTRGENAGGNPGKWDWEGAFIEMARIAVLDEDHLDRPTLNKKIGQWFVDTTGDQPTESSIREKVKRFHETLWPGRN